MRTLIRCLAAMSCICLLPFVTAFTANAAAGSSLGVWEVQTLDLQGNHEIFAVGASSLDDEWAVGREIDGFDTSLWAAHWDGTAWTEYPVPAGPGLQQYLESVAVLSPTDAWAAGSGGQADVSSAIVRHWDGTQWSEVSLPDLHAWSLGGRLVFSAPDDGWLTGQDADVGEGPAHGYIYHWDGAAWSRQDLSGSCLDETSFLYGITETSATDVWAVGECADLPVALHWDGISWTQTSVPTLPDAAYTEFGGVSAVAPDDVWAAGETIIPGKRTYVIEHWDGTAWSIVKSPDLPSEYELRDVAAISKDDVWGTGVTEDTTLLVEHWDGTSWSVVQGSPQHETSSLLATSQGTLWAATLSAAERLVEAPVTDAGPPKQAIQASPGDPVAWHFASANTKSHTVTDASGLGLFDSGPALAGGSFVYSYAAAGTYKILDAATGRKETVAVSPLAAFQGGKITVTWSALTSPPKGFVYDVRVLTPGATQYVTWLKGTKLGTSTYTPTGNGTYSFKARLRSKALGRASGWSPGIAVMV